MGVAEVVLVVLVEREGLDARFCLPVLTFQRATQRIDNTTKCKDMFSIERDPKNRGMVTRFVDHLFEPREVVGIRQTILIHGVTEPDVIGRVQEDHVVIAEHPESVQAVVVVEGDHVEC